MRKKNVGVSVVRSSSMTSNLGSLVAFSVVAAALAAAWCAVVVGTSNPYGPICGSPFTQITRNTSWHLKKLNVYTENGCIVGLKTQFGYKAADARLLGRQAATEKSISLGDSEYISGVETASNATCIKYLKFTTGKGQKLEAGTGVGTKVDKPRNDAYVFGFSGTALGGY